MTDDEYMRWLRFDFWRIALQQRRAFQRLGIEVGK